MEIREKVVRYYKRYIAYHLLLLCVLIVVPLVGILSDVKEQMEADSTVLLLSLSLYGVLLVVLSIPLVICCVMLRCGKYTAPFDEYYNSLDPSGKARLEEALQGNYQLGHAVLTEDCVVAVNKGNLSVAPYQDIVWAYINGLKLLPFWEVRFLVLVTRQKRLIQIGLTKKDTPEIVGQFLKLIQEKRPNLLVGYQPPWISLFKTDFEKMIGLSDHGGQ